MTDSIDRRARPAASWWNVTKTLVEIIALWFVFLIALPMVISIVEVKLAMQRFPGYPVLAAIMLAVFTLLGLWAALTLAIAGRGTPLPVDEVRTLVIAGPYAYVRHPIAIAAMGQGTAMVLTLGSYPVMIYVLAVAVWFYFVGMRKEERHLRQRFGERWKDYERQVRAFRPRLTPYREGR